MKKPAVTSYPVHRPYDRRGEGCGEPWPTRRADDRDRGPRGPEECTEYQHCARAVGAREMGDHTHRAADTKNEDSALRRAQPPAGQGASPMRYQHPSRGERNTGVLHKFITCQDKLV